MVRLWMVVGATEIWNKTLINPWRVLRTNHKNQEQNEATLEWIITIHQLLLRHKSLPSLFLLLYPSGILQTSCVCLTLIDFLSELPRSVALMDNPSLLKSTTAARDTGYLFRVFLFSQVLISWCFLMLLRQEMTSWLCLHCDYSPGSSVAVWEFK